MTWNNKESEDTDSVVDYDSGEQISGPSPRKDNAELKEVFDLFVKSPARKIWSYKGPQGKAAKVLLSEYGFEKVKSRLHKAWSDEKYLERYVHIYSPVTLLEKMPALEAQQKRI